MAKARKKRRSPLEIVLLEDEQHGKRGASAMGRTVGINRRSGKTRAKGWGARMVVKQRWGVTVDARDLARYVGGRVLAEIRGSFQANQDPETGATHSASAEDRVSRGWRGVRDKDAANKAGLDYLLANLRRTWMGKNYPKGNRRINQDRAVMKIYFSPGDRRGGGGFPNPAAAFNKLMAIRGDDQLGLGGKIDRLVEEAMGDWLEDALSGRYLGKDTMDEAFGRSFNRR